MQERADTVCHALDCISDPAHAFLDTSSNAADDIFAPVPCRGSYILDAAPDGRSNIPNKVSGIRYTFLNGIQPVGKGVLDTVPDIRHTITEAVTVIPQSLDAKTDTAEFRNNTGRKTAQIG